MATLKEQARKELDAAYLSAKLHGYELSKGEIVETIAKFYEKYIDDLEEALKETKEEIRGHHD